MEEEVRSDFTIALEIRTPQGRTLHVGSYVSPEHAYFASGPFPRDDDAVAIPHLHRVSPSGEWLATFDVEQRQLQLRRLVGDPLELEQALHEPRLATVEGLVGAPRQIRWLHDGSGFVIATAEAVFVVPYRPESGAATAEAHDVLGHDPSIRSIGDTRILPGGFIVQTRESVEGDAWVTEKGLYLVRVADDVVQDIEDLVPDDVTLQIANLRADGRIVMSIDEHDVTTPEVLVTLQPRVDGPAVEIERTACPDGWCEVVNWTPDTRRLGYATLDGRVVLDASPAPLQLRLDDDDAEHWEGTIHTLWASRDEQRIFAANDKRMRMWDQAGNVLWTWKARGKKKIESAQFAPDEKSVIAAVDRSIVRIENGKAETIVTRKKPRARRKKDGHTWNREVYIDGVQPLPGGAVAYMVVDLYSRTVGWDEVDTELDEDEIDAEADEVE